VPPKAIQITISRSALNVSSPFGAQSWSDDLQPLCVKIDFDRQRANHLPVYLHGDIDLAVHSNPSYDLDMNIRIKAD
jgi:hypothetical protein